MTLTAELRDVLGHDRVLSEPLEKWVYGMDSGVIRGDVQLVAFPESTAEVATIVRIAKHYRTPIVARGAGTGLAGGAVPTQPGLVVVLTRMNSIEIDVENATAWVGPGVINLDLSDRKSVV